MPARRSVLAIFTLTAVAVAPSCTPGARPCRSDDQCDLGQVCVVDDGAGVGACGTATAGEGEGEGEGEGKGEGEGEGEGERPSCEEAERLVVVRDDRSDALQVYATVGGFLRRRPTGVVGDVVLDNDDPSARNNGYGASAFALGSDDRLYVVGDSFAYQLQRSTLTQQDIAGRTMALLQVFGSYDTVQVLGGRIVAGGADIRALVEDAAVGATFEPVYSGDTFLRSTAFSLDGTDYAAFSADHGWVVLSSTGGAAPTSTFVDTEFDTDRIHDFGDGFTPKGIAFDATTRQLLVGDQGRVLVARPEDGFALPDVAGDFVLADGGTPDVVAVAAQGGVAWVLLKRGRDNLITLDLTTSPPTARALLTVPGVDNFGRAIAVGCRRVFIASYDRVVAVDRETLSSPATLSVRDVKQVTVVSRAALGLQGDDGP